MFVSVKGGDRLIGTTSGESLAFPGKKKKGKKGKKKAQNLFRPKPGRSYSFYSVAVDGAGNREAAPSQPDATHKFQQEEAEEAREAEKQPLAGNVRAGGEVGLDAAFDCRGGIG